MRRTWLVLALLAAAFPVAARSEAVSAAQADAARAWRGKLCPPTGCGPAPAATAASVLGFAAAALGAGWVARRRDRAPR